MPRKAAPDEEGPHALFDLAIALFEDGSPEATEKAFDLSYWIMMMASPGLTIAWNAWLNMALHVAKMGCRGEQPSEKARRYVAAGYYRIGVDYAGIDGCLGIGPGDAAYEIGE